MPRLPVGDTGNDNGGAPLTVKVGWGALLLIVLAAALWLFGVYRLDELLAIDTQCDNTRYYGRGAELGEILRCSVEAGPKGWFYVAWLGAFPFLLVTWLERRLRKAMLARRNVRLRD